VHAEVQGQDWLAFCEALEADQSNNKFHNLSEMVLWSRQRVQNHDTTPIESVSRVYVGHTPMKQWAILGNVYYLDTGAVFGNELTLLEVA
jgi:serine/threonine protein phosphatase 1